MKKSPMQTVKDKFGGRADLVAKLVPMVDKMHGDDSDDAVRSRLDELQPVLAGRSLRPCP